MLDDGLGYTVPCCESDVTKKHKLFRRQTRWLCRRTVWAASRRCWPGARVPWPNPAEIKHKKNQRYSDKQITIDSDVFGELASFTTCLFVHIVMITNTTVICTRFCVNACVSYSARFSEILLFINLPILWHVRNNVVVTLDTRARDWCIDMHTVYCLSFFRITTLFFPGWNMQHIGYGVASTKAYNVFNRLESRRIDEHTTVAYSTRLYTLWQIQITRISTYRLPESKITILLYSTHHGSGSY